MSSTNFSEQPLRMSLCTTKCCVLTLLYGVQSAGGGAAGASAAERKDESQQDEHAAHQEDQTGEFVFTLSHHAYYVGLAIYKVI